MEWVLSVNYDRKSIRLKAKIIFNSPLIEIITVTGRNRSMTLQCNRPLLLAKGLKHSRISWKLIDGSLSDTQLLANIITALETRLKDS